MNNGLSYNEEQHLERMADEYDQEMVLNFKDAVTKWMEWANINFPKSDTKASLIHLREEVKELVEAMETPGTYTENEGVILMEFADCLICILTAAGKSGFTIDELMRAIKNKMEINYKRKWVLNPDNTYSHVK